MYSQIPFCCLLSSEDIDTHHSLVGDRLLRVIDKKWADSSRSDGAPCEMPSLVEQVVVLIDVHGAELFRRPHVVLRNQQEWKCCNRYPQRRYSEPLFEAVFKNEQMYGVSAALTGDELKDAERSLSGQKPDVDMSDITGFSQLSMGSAAQSAHKLDEESVSARSSKGPRSLAGDDMDYRRRREAAIHHSAYSGDGAVHITHSLSADCHNQSQYAHDQGVDSNIGYGVSGNLWHSNTTPSIGSQHDHLHQHQAIGDAYNQYPTGQSPSSDPGNGL